MRESRDEGRGTRERDVAASAAREPPDGGSYGSRWSRAQRETTGSNMRDGNSTPAGVAYQIPGGVDSLRDRCRGRKIGTRSLSGGLALRARPPATVRDAIRRRNRGFARVTRVETGSSASRLLIPLGPRPSFLPHLPVPASSPSSLIPHPSSLLPLPRPCLISLVPASSLPHLLRTAGIATLPRFLGIFAIAWLLSPAPRLPPNQSQDRGSSQCSS